MPRKVTVIRKVARKKGSKLNPRQKTQVKRLIGNKEEHKEIDTTILLSPSNTGVIQQVSLPIQGQAYNERDGDDISLQSLHYRFNFVAADATNYLRMIIFRWHNNNAVAVPTTADVLQTVSATAYPNNQKVVDGSVQILLDRAYALNLNGNASMAVSSKLFGKRLGRKKLGFNAAATTGNNQIYFLWISDSAAIGHPAVGGTIRLIYTD